ncbi:MAG: 2-hydroxyacyl-CoA dehydratase family protein [Chloroflexota bacterium]
MSEHVAGLAREYRASGAIMLLEKFCHPHEWDAPTIEKGLKDVGVPTLILEVDVTVPRGQIRTRVEAFLEMISS